MVFRDKEGRPHFTVNNESERFMMIMDRRCSICGDALLPEFWFVGGPLSAFMPQGVYNDPPMHRDCLHFAMRVCPYMLMPKYGKRIDAKTIKDDSRIYIDPNQIGYDSRPVFFVAVCTTDFENSSHGRDITSAFHMIPARPYRRVEFWQDGKMFPEAVAMPVLRPIIDAEIARLDQLRKEM